MRTHKVITISLIAGLFQLFTTPLFAQGADHGSSANRGRNIHAGNKVRMTFSNNGSMGTERLRTGDYTGEWPVGTGQVQMGNASPFVMSELRFFKGLDPVTGDSLFDYLTPAIFCQGWDPAMFSHDSAGVHWGFEPLSGYLNLNTLSKDPGHAVAMSHMPSTWPFSWNNHWQGFDGNDRVIADEESYFVLDDYSFKKKFNNRKLPLPVASEPDRGGLGLELSVRGLQWSDPYLEDMIFWIYDLKNKGNLDLNKTVFGMNVGSANGNLLNGGGSDNSDDAFRFYREKAFVVSYDLDNLGVGGYTPVPWMGFALLETPGNPLDGIDNDGDANSLGTPGGGTGKVITENDFTLFYAVDAQIVTIDYHDSAYPRTIKTMPAEGIKISHNGTNLILKPNAPLIEIPRNGIDDNLNGLIDESDGTKIYDPVLKDSVSYFLYIKSDYNNQDYLAIDYFTGEGKNNRLIDERKDDGIDNDGDWNNSFDDLGIDGKPNTYDSGEGDGVPTPGTSSQPGEPNIDQTDSDESDQIGLTGLRSYIYSALTYSNDEQLWEFSRPGVFNNSTIGQADYDYLFSTGYFPLKPNNVGRMSVALIFANDEQDILRNKYFAKEYYKSNFNAILPPEKPTVTAVSGKNSIKIMWDDVAEESYDPWLRAYDFEGYKVYKSETPSFRDVSGNLIEPIAVFDKIDSIFGYFPKDFGNGQLFFLGNETGLSHSLIDNNVKNGVPYYYAVTSYDRGDLIKNMGPQESTVYIEMDSTGFLYTDQNVVRVFAGDSLPPISTNFDFIPVKKNPGFTEAVLGVNVINSDSLEIGDEYQIQFLDCSMDKRDNDFNGLTDSFDQNEVFPTETTGFVLKNLTKNQSDTSWIYTYAKNGQDYVLLRNLYDDSDGNPRTLTSGTMGLQVYVKNPVAGIYNNPEKGVVKGITWHSVSNLSPYKLEFDLFSQGGLKPGTFYPRQYMVVFYNNLVSKSQALNIPIWNSGSIKLPAIDVNYKVFEPNRIDPVTGRIAEVKFGASDVTKIWKNKQPAKGIYSAGDRIILYEELPDGSTVITFQLFNNTLEDSTFYNTNGRFIGEGDTLLLTTTNELKSTDVYSFTLTSTGIEENNAGVKPVSFSLSQNYPNPFNPATVINYQLPVNSMTKLKIYDVIGREVATLVNEMKPAGRYQVTFNAGHLSSGVYFYRIEAGSFVQTKKLILVK
ncbi:MAG: T9SS type A sorting domain-containing protein [Bacteroidetes bacterium]|nr:T9SS type A sorting domain-containing protein [Bacteroidota bacterium]